MSGLVQPSETRSPEQRAVYDRIHESGECPFCGENFKKTHPLPVLHETDHWFVTLNAWPYAGSTVHALLVYKPGHAKTFDEIPTEARGDFFGCVAWINQHFAIEAGAIVIRYGKPGDNGQSVEHLHGHVIVGGPKEGSTESLKVKVGYKAKAGE
jgi:ATP adenylyltransferase